ncbi:MAG: hypothetical protein AAF721_37795 [Myxococcota bacterium]
MAAQQALEALVEEMTLRQLAERTGRSVGDIVAWAMHSSSRSSKASTSTTKPKTKASATGARSVDVRKAAGRKAYDKAVLAVVIEASGPTSAQEVRKSVGGTPAQARSALNRLIEGGRIGSQGRARATRYFPKR